MVTIRSKNDTHFQLITYECGHFLLWANPISGFDPGDCLGECCNPHHSELKPECKCRFCGGKEWVCSRNAYKARRTCLLTDEQLFARIDFSLLLNKVTIKYEPQRTSMC